MRDQVFDHNDRATNMDSTGGKTRGGKDAFITWLTLIQGYLATGVGGTQEKIK